MYATGKTRTAGQMKREGDDTSLKVSSCYLSNFYGDYWRFETSGAGWPSFRQTEDLAYRNPPMDASLSRIGLCENPKTPSAIALLLYHTIAALLDVFHFDNNHTCRCERFKERILLTLIFGRLPQINDSYVPSQPTWCAAFSQQQKTRSLTSKLGLSRAGL